MDLQSTFFFSPFPSIVTIKGIAFAARNWPHLNSGLLVDDGQAERDLAETRFAVQYDTVWVLYLKKSRLGLGYHSAIRHHLLEYDDEKVSKA